MLIEKVMMMGAIILGSTWRNQKIVILFDTDHGASNGSGTPDASGYAQNHNDLEETLSRNGHDGQQEEQSREGHPGINKSLHHQVHFPSQESGETADQDRDDHIERRRGQTDG